MRDEENRLALIAQSNQHLEEAGALLRCQHGGRLIEDQQTAIADQQLDQFDPLLGTDRELPDRGVEFEVQVKLVENLLNLLTIFTSRVEVRHLVERQQNVFEDGMRRDQHKMLMDHTYA